MRCIMVYFKLGMIVLLLLSVSVKIRVSSEDDRYNRCEHIVTKWASSSLDYDVKSDKHELRDLLYFLHIPRTGGRTYLHCFLKKLYSNSQECPRSYDKLRFNPRKTDCHLFSTHDDYSMMSKLSMEETSVVTILRNPIDRIFSTYEFSMEVAARFLIHPNLTSVARMAKRMRKKTSSVSTLDIWPWKFLVPWMREDLFARRNARKLKGEAHLATNNPYDMEDILMPLHEYINHPIAQDIIHNGATFQIAGLTNNSYFVDSHEVRRCVLKYQNLGEYVLQVAKNRLDDMLYVGLTENHRESATMFANVVGAQVISQHLASGSSRGVTSNDDSEQSSSLPDAQYGANKRDNNTRQKQKNDSSTGQDEPTVGKLMEAYESCVSSLRNTQSERRMNSLKQISPANLTKEARLLVPEALIREITLLNSLDVELYKYAQDIFTKQQSHMMQRMAYAEKVESTFDPSMLANFHGPPSWKVLSLVAIAGFLSLIFIFLFLNSKRTSKIKL